MAMKDLKIFVALLALCLTVETAVAGELQMRGTACENGDLSMSAITLTRPAYVVKVESASGIFCIIRAEDSSGAEEIICTDYEINGQALMPGTYRVFPYLQPNKAIERVIIYLR
ncbi:MAG: hypothetical protein HQL01_08550 [Nitrospirae bacterium]|uniref:Uncharacterized protein n=1 Tax=uncultured Nitrospirae bacterium MY3-5B TaxID=798578 RepID=D9MP28_9BACT|nr:hypothetical protein LW3_0140 [uncultured Nitrospirae bacterium MY3-5B]MBF0319834.1 hypothetical protein [Nitrospirota bacterium]